MPTVPNNRPHTPERGMHSRDHIAVTDPKTVPRNELSGDFAGDENEAFSQDKPHSSHLKDRNTRKVRDEKRTPIR